ncbi:MAG: hypothetical protein M3276_00345 [Actinomycetota bacterium]|nr:hypothetical protein [Actinomycetota bacterium]
MSKVINCDGGAVTGRDDVELSANARRQLQQAHPQLDLSDARLLAMAVEEEARP